MTGGAEEEMKENSDGGVRNQASSQNLHAANDAHSELPPADDNQKYMDIEDEEIPIENQSAL